MDDNKLDFEQARINHLSLKYRLRSILYGTETGEAPVLSQYECDAGKWIYGQALKAYGHIPEMQELEKVHAETHTTAKELVTLYKYGKVDEARSGLNNLEKFADQLVELLNILEKKLEKTEKNNKPPVQIKKPEADLEEYQELLKNRLELEKENKALREKVAELEKKLKKLTDDR